MIIKSKDQYTELQALNSFLTHVNSLIKERLEDLSNLQANALDLQANIQRLSSDKPVVASNVRYMSDYKKRRLRLV